jgi:capsular exopolysaccharide synthesis family protein
MSNETLITLTNPRSAAAEAYRTLRTSIEFSGVDERLQTLLVTSSAPTENRSATVANLAVVMADGDRTVILVDADLRRPAQHTLFGLNNEQGFTNMFRDADSLNQPPLQPVPNTSLQVLTSGPLPPIPGQLLSSQRIDEVIARLAGLAEIVIFDAPPLVTVNDASLLASKVDGVLLVVKAGGTKRDHIRAARDRLEKVNARLIGAVLTDAQVDATLQYT